MKKYIVPILSAIVIGFLLARMMMNQYDKKEKLKPVFGESETLYFLNRGNYVSKEEMEKEMKQFTYYIYTKKDERYYAYIAISKVKDNTKKLQDYFKKLGYDTTVEEIKVEQASFLEVLGQYDKLLEETKDEKTIQTICSQVLSKYEELVLNHGEN